MNTEVNRLPVAQLSDRYDISRSVLYSRLSALRIEPQKLGKKSYVNSDQLQLLDRLHEHLQQGGITAEFLELSGISSGEQSVGQITELSGEQSGGQLTKQSAEQTVGQIINVQEALSALLEQIPKPSAQWMESLRFLEEAYQNRWLLSTSQLAQLLGLSAITISRRQTFERYGFIFNRAGHNGAEVAWEISKPKKKK